jgi:hypothetical protein
MYSNAEQRYVWESEAIYDLKEKLPTYLVDDIVEAVMKPFPSEQ